MKSWQFLITNSSEIMLLINIVLSMIYFWKNLPVLRYFCGLLSFSLIIQAIAKVMWLQKMNNLSLLHLYTVGEFLLMSFFYFQIFDKNSIWKKQLGWFIGSVTALIIANSIFLQPITVFNTYSKTLTQVIYIVYAVVYFWQATNNQPHPFHSVLKTINSAILLYYTGSLFIFMFGNVFFQLDEFHRIFWVANALLYLIFQLLVFTAIWQFRQTKSTYS